MLETKKITGALFNSNRLGCFIIQVFSREMNSLFGLCEFFHVVFI